MSSERTPLLQRNTNEDGDNAAIVVTQPTEQSFEPDGTGTGTTHKHEIASFAEDGLLDGLSRTKIRCIIGGVYAGYFITLFDGTLMASSHPVITSYFHASNAASWLSTAFLITVTALQPLLGRISDTFGRRKPYLYGIMFLAASTAWCALAQSVGSFIAARAFCGFGAAAVITVGNMMINDLVSMRIRGTYQAYTNIFYGGGSAAGAAFGGVLCENLGWRLTFAIQVPLLLFLFVNAYLTIPADLGPSLAIRSGKGVKAAMKGFDYAGCLLLTPSIAFLILGLNLGGNIYPWSHPLVIVSLVIALVTGVLLIRIESRAEKPLMPLNMLFTRPRGNIVFQNFTANIGINTIMFNAPLYFQAVKLESASISGYRLAAASTALMITGVSSGFIMTATGRMHSLMIVGNLFLLLGSICLSVLWDGIPSWLVMMFVVPASIGQGLSFPATSVAVLATSTYEDQAVMTGTLVVWRSLGTVMGVCISSVILQNALRAYLEILVIGPHKRKVISTVRKSVHAIASLDAAHQAQVIDAYSRSLKVTFMSTFAFSIAANILILVIRLPNLKDKKPETDNPVASDIVEQDEAVNEL